MAKSKLVEANEKIAEKVTDTFGKIEDAVVGGYSKIENSVVGGYSKIEDAFVERYLAKDCLLYTSPSPRDRLTSRMPSSA